MTYNDNTIFPSSPYRAASEEQPYVLKELIVL